MKYYCGIIIIVPEVVNEEVYIINNNWVHA